MANFRVWNARLGDPKYGRLRRWIEDQETQVGDDDDEICEGCIMGKSTVKTFSKSIHGQMKTKEALVIIHSDVMGPMETKSQGGSRFILSFIDDFTREIVAYYNSNKPEVMDSFVEYKALIENQLSKKIECIRTFNGSEYRRFSECVKSSESCTRRRCHIRHNRMGWPNE